MRVTGFLLVSLALVACDAGAKPEPVKAAPRGSAVEPAMTDCKAVIRVLHAARYSAWIKEPPPPPVSESLRILGPTCAKWPESVKACIVAGSPLGECAKQYPELTDELLLLGFEPGAKGEAAVDSDPTCGQVMEHLSSAVFAYDPKYLALAGTYAGRVLASCHEDGWPEDLQRCIVTVSPRALLDHACDKHVSDELANKVVERLGLSVDPGQFLQR